MRYTHIGVVKGVGRTGRIVSFSLEDMTEVTAACCAGNFYPGHTVRAVFVSRYRARYSFNRARQKEHRVGKKALRDFRKNRPSKKAGQPQPLSNLVVLLYRGVSQPAHV